MFKNLGASVILTYSFNLGSLLGFILIMQILSGLLMVLFYEPVFSLAFSSVQYMMFEVNGGWFFRLIHFNGASFFFLFLYLHFFKALFYSSMKLLEVWFFGLLIFIFLMMEAFLGYTLVWSQMSFWAGTVITSLLSVVPFFGKNLVYFIWGGFGLNSGTLKFFYLVHFVSPFLILFLVFFHLFFLHFYGSTSDLGFSSKLISRSFFPYYWFKDFLNFFIFLFFFIFLTCFPFLLGDSLGFEDVNELVSPVHIVPEWYFLWAYAILRAIPSKIFGVLLLLMSIVVFFCFFSNYNPSKDVFQKCLVLVFIFNVVVLTFLGGSEPLYPFVFLSQVFSCFYFLVILLMFFVFNNLLLFISVSIFFLVAVCFFLVAVFFMMNYFFFIFVSFSSKKLPFESGFNSLGKLVLSYSLSFFFLVLVFVFFDVELFFVFFLIFFSDLCFFLFVFFLFLILFGFFVEWKFVRLVWIVK